MPRPGEKLREAPADGRGVEELVRRADAGERLVCRARGLALRVEVEHAALLEEALARLPLEFAPEGQRASTEVGVEGIGVREAEDLRAVDRGSELVAHDVALAKGDAHAAPRELDRDGETHDAGTDDGEVHRCGRWFSLGVGAG